jgi:hypothetical protein
VAQSLVDAAVIDLLCNESGEERIDQATKAFVDFAQPAMTELRSAAA